MCCVKLYKRACKIRDPSLVCLVELYWGSRKTVETVFNNKWSPRSGRVGRMVKVRPTDKNYCYIICKACVEVWQVFILGKK